MVHDLGLSAMSRRRFLQIGAGLGLAAAVPALWRPSTAWGVPTTIGTGTTPEQVHLLWAFGSGQNPANSVIVSWVQPQPSASPFVTFAPATTGLGGAGATTVLGSVNTQAGGNVGNAIPAAGSPSGTFGGFGFSYQDLLDGEHIYVYSALLTGLAPATAYVYAISDGNGNSFPTAAAPATFATAATSPDGRLAYRFTSYGDLATPTPLTGDTYGDNYLYTAWSESSPNSYPAVNAVEYFAPLFHLLNGDLCYADKNPANQPEVWRDFGINVQRSAMNRPWMPCLGNHEAELSNGYSSYLSRYVLPDNGVGYPGNFYHYQVGSVLFVALDGNDVVYQDSAPYVATAVTYANESLAVGASGFNRYYSGTPASTYADDPNLKAPTGNVQAVWLQNVLASARPALQPAEPPSPITIDPSIVPSSIDWIVVQMHQCAMSSSFDNGGDKGIRELWKPLFDQYEVDLVVNGHDHDYERTYPVRGYTPGQGAAVSGGTPVETLQPTPVATTFPTTATGTGTAPLIDSTQGTTYLVLGGGGTNAQDNSYVPTDGAPAGTAGVHTQTIRKTPSQTKPPADAYEVPVWSAVTDPEVSGVNSPYGIAVFDVDPGSGPGADTSLTVTYYHAVAFKANADSTAPAPGTNPGYSQFDQVVLTRARSDGSVPTALPQFGVPALAVGAAVAAAAGTVYLTQRGRVDEPVTAG
jgi:hypothetical protein